MCGCGPGELGMGVTSFSSVKSWGAGGVILGVGWNSFYSPPLILKLLSDLFLMCCYTFYICFVYFNIDFCIFIYDDPDRDKFVQKTY